MNLGIALRSATFILLFPTFVVAEGNQLFFSVPSPEESLEKYKTLFRNPPGEITLVKFVTDPGDGTPPTSLSLTWERRGDEKIHRLSSSMGSQPITVDWKFARELRDLCHDALKFSQRKSERLPENETLHLFHVVDVARKEWGWSPPVPADGVPGSVIQLLTQLQQESVTGSINAETWTQRFEELGKTFPSMELYANYIEAEGVENLRTHLDLLTDLGIAHRFSAIKMYDSFSLKTVSHFRRELATALAKTAPKAWSELEKSTWRNPPKEALNPHLTPAAKQTPTVQAIDMVLADYGLRVEYLSVEKFYYPRINGTRVPTGILGLGIEKAR
ncbi:MAG: hypothetical protein AAGH89_04675 [Verrucomicrobiota bacterium]